MSMYLYFLILFVFASCSHKPLSVYQEQLQTYQKKSNLGVQRSEKEIKALWIVRSSIKTKQNILEVLDLMQEYHLNTAIVQVRGLGDTLYKSMYEPMADEIEEGLDPLAFFIEEAKKKSIDVEAWINVNMISKPSFVESYTKLDKHFITKSPHLVLKDSSERSMLDYKEEELSSDWMDGAYVDPARKEVVKYLQRITDEIISNYDIQGIHLDFIRYPFAKEGGKIFGLDSEFVKESSRFTGLSSKEEYLKYPQYQKILDVWKLKKMNDLVRSLSETVKKKKKDILLTAAVWAHKEKVYSNVFQDWPYWIDQSWIDRAYMMIYVLDKEVHDKRMEEFFELSRNSKLVIGVGLYREPNFSLLEHQIVSSRAIGAAGFCVFSAESLKTLKDKYKYKGLASLFAD